MRHLEHDVVCSHLLSIAVLLTGSLNGQGKAGSTVPQGSRLCTLIHVISDMINISHGLSSAIIFVSFGS